MSQPAEQRRLTYLARMGIDVWVPRHAEPAPVEEPPVADALAEPVDEQANPPAAPVAEPVPTAAEAPVLDWPALEAEVAGCRACGLCEGRTQTVFGVGARDAELMIVGEAPGAEEDRQGEPFVGRAGQLLTNMLFAMGFNREQVFIANILKCRPPNNRDPRPDEVAACEPYLRRQLELVRPKLILAVGRVAAQNLLGTDQPLGKLRGQLHRYGPQDTPLLVTYHPAYLLRAPAEKAKAWQDLKRALVLLAGTEA